MDFAAGEHLTVWSQTEGKWADAIVLEKAPANLALQGAPGAPPVVVPAGSILVSYSGGALRKWMSPCQFGTYALKVKQSEQIGAGSGDHLPPVFSSTKRAVRLPNTAVVAQDQIPEEEEDDSSPTAVVQCDKGHAMFAKVAREMFNVVRASRTNTCVKCGQPIDLRADAFYRCRVCSIEYCMACAYERLDQQGMGHEDPLVEVMAGDIFFFGPDHWGIHHTVLSRGRMKPAQPDIVELLELPAGSEVFECPTIESTRGSKGEDTEWYPATTYFQRIHGAAVVVADLPMDSAELQVADPPVGLKVLFHPLRDGRLDNKAFGRAVDLGSKTADRYGKRQAVKAWLAQAVNRGVPEVIQAEKFPSVHSRANLLEDLRKRWDQRPICAALCIKVWQMYFELKGQETGKLDEAVQEIIRWMPVYSDRTTPSALLKALTAHGWMLHQL